MPRKRRVFAREAFLTASREVPRMSVLKMAERARNGAAAMDKKRLEYYKKKLQARREELLKSIARTEEEGRTADDDPTVDLADKAANSYTKEFLFGMTNTDRSLLALIDEALIRIRNGAYGTCVERGEELQQKRLEAVPWARYCVSCAEKHEQGLL